MPAQNVPQGGGGRSKEVTGRMVFICLVAFFVVVAGVNAVMIHAAVSTFGGVETDSSYRAGLVFAHEAASVQAQDDLHWQVTAKVATQGDVTTLEVIALDAAGKPVENIDATAAIAHPEDRRGDLAVALLATRLGVFRGTTAAIVGQRDLVIELSRNGERLFRSKNRLMIR